MQHPYRIVFMDVGFHQPGLRNESRLTFMKIHKNIFMSIYITDPCLKWSFT